MTLTPPRAVPMAAIFLGLGWPSAPAVAQGGPPPASVIVEAVHAQSVQDRRRVTGELRAHRRSRVATQEAGVVVELPVEEGAIVKAGDVLARLDARRMELLKSELVADREAAAALVEERQALLAWRARDLELYQSSFDRGAANARELADARSQHAIAQAAAHQAQRRREVIKAREDLIGERLADMTIRAPYDGVVVTRAVELGEWVDEGGSVMELVSTDRVEAWLEVPQRLLGAISGRDVEIAVTIEAAERSLTTRHKRVIPLVDPRARSFYVVAEIAGVEARGLAPGMSVVAWVPTGERRERLVVSRNAILRNETGAYLYVARGGGGERPAQAVPVQVRELFPIGTRSVVESLGLQEGDLVVVEGNERLFPMVPVKPVLQDPDGPGPTAGSKTSPGKVSAKTSPGKVSGGGS